MYLLDTNVVSDIVRDASGKVARRAAEVGGEQYAVSIIVAGEILYGIENAPGSRRARLVRGLLDQMTILPFEQPAERAYARLRAKLTRTGVGLGANDLLIAAHAVSLDATLVSGDRAFGQVRDLKLENWLD